MWLDCIHLPSSGPARRYRMERSEQASAGVLSNKQPECENTKSSGGTNQGLERYSCSVCLPVELDVGLLRQLAFRADGGLDDKRAERGGSRALMWAWLVWLWAGNQCKDSIRPTKGWIVMTMENVQRVLGETALLTWASVWKLGCFGFSER